jgi:TetR/AcrR family transcriptional repressor of bet genes|tara:strand:+ start:250 stop:924 length:675 start_codon:yes stop_codon:yes gene_type:complete
MDVTEAQKSPQSHRSRAVQSLVRKQQLIGSTIDCIDQFGLSQTTIAKIAHHAGVSQGVVIFHFQTKELLLEQVLRFLSKEYTHNWKSAIAVAGEAPIDQLCAIVLSAFSPEVCNRKNVGVWYAFWGASQSRPTYQEVCGQTDREFSSTLLSLCTQLCVGVKTSVSAEVAAMGIEGMLDGLWQSCLIEESKFSPKEANKTVFALMGLMFPSEKSTIEEYKLSFLT